MVDIFGEYFLARMQADPEVEHLVDPFVREQNALRTAHELEREQNRRRQREKAKLDHALFQMNRTVREFELALLAHVKKDRKAAEYRRFFPNGMLATTTAPAAAGVASVHQMERQLGENAGMKDAAVWLADLAQRREMVERAQAQYAEANADHVAARTAERLARDAWRRLYRGTYGELIALFPADRRRVGAYFREGPRREERAEPAPPAAQPAASPPAPPAAGSSAA